MDKCEHNNFKILCSLCRKTNVIADKNFYAVAKGKNTGIFTTWSECSSNITGFSCAIYKKCNTKKEAEKFLLDNSENQLDDFNPDYYVYTDGSCANNGKENAMAGIGIYFGENDSRNTSKKVEGKQSNNTAELDAIRQTFKIIEKDIISGKKVCIVSDSEYAIKCVTTYGQKCSETNWTKDIPNKELVNEIYNMYKNINNVKFIHIMAHTGNNDIHSIGNDGADKLANQAIGLEHCPYSKLYLNVPFSKKDEIKTFGGRWDSGKKQWFIFDNNKEKTKILSKFKTII